MSDLGTFVTEYFVTAPTDEPGITELQRYAGPYIKAAGFGEAREIAERLTPPGTTVSVFEYMLSSIGQRRAVRSYDAVTTRVGVTSCAATIQHRRTRVRWRASFQD